MSSSVTRKRNVDLSTYVPRVTGLTVEEAAASVEARAVYRVAVDTATLRDSIHRREIQRDVVWEVVATAGHAIYVEFGTGDQGSDTGPTWVYWSDRLQRFVTTSGMEAQPYMRPAVDEVRSHLARIWAAKHREATR